MCVLYQHRGSHSIFFSSSLLNELEKVSWIGFGEHLEGNVNNSCDELRCVIYDTAACWTRQPMLSPRSSSLGASEEIALVPFFPLWRRTTCVHTKPSLLCAFRNALPSHSICLYMIAHKEPWRMSEQFL